MTKLLEKNWRRPTKRSPIPPRKFKQSEQITKDEGEQVEEKKDLEKVTRRELRQKCAVMFPAVFTQFTKAKASKTSGMCPCQGSATGVSQISLAIDVPEEAD